MGIDSVGGKVKPVSGHEDYLVSECGRVFNTMVRNKNTAKRLDQPRELKPSFKNGYARVKLHKDGAGIIYSVHRIVLLAFMGPCPEGFEGSHLDGARTNNHIDNLVWETRSENHQRKKEHGTGQHGSKHGFAKLSESDVVEIKRELAKGCIQKDLAKRFKIDEKVITNIKHGRAWVHVR